MTINAQRIEDTCKVNNSTDLLGQLVTSGKYMVAAKPRHLLDSIKRHGLDDMIDAVADYNDETLAWEPRQVNPSKAFRRACMAAQSRVPNIKIDKAREDAYEITYAISERTVNKDTRKVTYRQVAQVCFLPAEATENFLYDNAHPAVAHIESSLAFYRAHLVPDDITVLVNEAMRRSDAINPSITQGSTRFVPARHAERMEKLRAVLADLGTEPGAPENAGAHLRILDVANTRNNRATTTDDAQAHFASQVSELEGQLASLEAAVDEAAKDEDKAGPRASTLDRRMADLAEVAQGVELYAGLLSFKATDLEGRMGKLKKGFRKIVLGL